MRSAHLSLIDRRARIPSTSSGSSWSACASDSSSWSRPLASPRHHSQHRSARCAPSSLRSPSSAFFLLSTDVLRSPVAVPCGEPPAASDPVRTSAAGGAGKPSVPIHAAALQPGVTPPRRRDSPPTPASAPATADGPASHARRAPAPTPDSMSHASAPPTRNPPRRSLDAQGRTPAGGPQGPRHFFGFFAPCAARANNAKN